MDTTEDKNTYYIALNKTSNAGYLAISTLFIGIFYIVIIYLFSFIYIPTDQISNESALVSSFLFNPKSAVDVFSKFVKTECSAEHFSNMSKNTTIELITNKIDEFTSYIQYWFHRLLLIFYINKNTISSTQKINRISFMDIKI